MKLVKVGAAVLNQTPLDWPGNLRRIEAALQLARAEEVSLLCLPELCITGYGCEDMFHSPGVRERALGVLQQIAPQTHGMVTCIGLPVAFRNATFNAACVLVDGRIAGLVAKKFLAGDGIHYEPRWFKPWPEDQRGELEIGGAAVPLGDLYFDIGGVKVGFEICEDAWVPNRPGAELSKGIDVLCNPSASHFAFGKFAVRQGFVVEGSRAFGVTYLYANLLGNEAGRAIFDGGALIASGGTLVAAGPRLGFDEVGLTTAVVDLELTRMRQARTGSFSPDLEGHHVERVVVPFRWPERRPEPGDLEARPAQAAWERGEHGKEEEFTRAIALALFDYLRKSRSHGFVISLSGGADSAACACLVKLMVDLALADLGREGLLRRLDHVRGLAACETPEALVGALLTTVYQATANSGPVTREAARVVADALGARHLDVSVEALVQGYTALASEALGRPLTWERDDIALQNIQARVRAPSVWMLANVQNALLISTSNRSEAAVGYATMDGDTAGGLSPIAGIDKAFLRRWLAWLERTGPDGHAPLPALRAVNVQQPTAELRPPGEGQTDEGDLMPYPLLDAIERAAIRDKRTPLEVYQLMRADFPDLGPELLLTYVDRFFRLWCRNQWKRERYAPSFHVDDENLDPKTWCRFPILSGGFHTELAELARLVRDGGA